VVRATASIDAMGSGSVDDETITYRSLRALPLANFCLNEPMMALVNISTQQQCVPVDSKKAKTR
jgi:hypothetical protein